MTLLFIAAGALIMLVCYQAGRRIGCEETRAELEQVITKLRSEKLSEVLDLPTDENLGDA